MSNIIKSIFVFGGMLINPVVNRINRKVGRFLISRWSELLQNVMRERGDREELATYWEVVAMLNDRESWRKTSDIIANPKGVA